MPRCLAPAARASASPSSSSATRPASRRHRWRLPVRTAPKPLCAHHRWRVHPPTLRVRDRRPIAGSPKYSSNMACQFRAGRGRSGCRRRPLQRRGQPATTLARLAREPELTHGCGQAQLASAVVGSSAQESSAARTLSCSAASRRNHVTWSGPVSDLGGTFGKGQAPAAMPRLHGRGFASRLQALSGVGAHRLQEAIAGATVLGPRRSPATGRSVASTRA